MKQLQHIRMDVNIDLSGFGGMDGGRESTTGIGRNQAYYDQLDFKNICYRFVRLRSWNVVQCIATIIRWGRRYYQIIRLLKRVWILCTVTTTEAIIKPSYK